MWMWLANICAMQRDTTRRRTSPMTSPRTLPLGFWGATILPNPNAVAMVVGIWFCARRWHACVKRLVVASSSRTTRSVSAVRPEGPGAAPFLERRSAVISAWAGICSCCSGANCWMCGCMAAYGSGGLLVGSWSCASVASVPGAGGIAVRACLAADSSPWWTSCLARAARLSGEGVPGAKVVAEKGSCTTLGCKSCCHCPC